MKLTELQKAYEREYYNKAREYGGKIQLIVTGDYNDADYMHQITEFSPEEFLKMEVYKSYIILKDTMQNEIRLDETVKKYLYCGKRPTAGEVKEPELKDFVANYNLFSDYLPCATAYNEEIHTITEVKLNIIVEV